MKIIRGWLIAGLGTLAMAAGTAEGQVTFGPGNHYVRCDVDGTQGIISSGEVEAVFNTPLSALAISGNTISDATGTFVSSPGYALMRVDVENEREAGSGKFSSTTMNITFTITETMSYELSGEYTYVGANTCNFGATFRVSSSLNTIYSAQQTLNTSGTAVVGAMPSGPGGLTTGFIGPGSYSVLMGPTLQSLSPHATALGSGFMQLKLGELPCPEDLNDDTQVNVTDLLTLLGAWGSNPGHVADINGDTNVNVTDLLALLAAWGPCP